MAVRVSTEKQLEKAVCDYARRFLDVPSIKIQFGRSGAAGWPDRLFIIPGGRPLFIEFKRPGNKTTKLQDHRIEDLKARGYDVEVIYDVPTGRDCIRQACERAVGSAQLPEESS